MNGNMAQVGMHAHGYPETRREAHTSEEYKGLSG